MAQIYYFTFKDAVRHCLDFVGVDVSDLNKRRAKMAVLAAYRELANSHRWSYYYSRGRINTNTPQSSSTVSYDHTGSVYERELTLASGTWPTWAAYGIISINNVPYEVSSYKSSTILQLSVNSNPGADVASGTSYVLYRDTYPLPIDFISSDQFFQMGGCVRPSYVHPTEWLVRQGTSQSVAQPRMYTFRGSPDFAGAMAVSFWPPPDTTYAFDFVYQRRPRQIALEEYATGTCTVSNGSAVVAGSGTTFTSKHTGAILRLSPNGTDEADGLVFGVPYSQERLVTTYTSATSVTCDSSFSETLSGVKYAISDPCDVEEGTMLTAFQRCMEWQLSKLLNMKEQDRCYQAWQEALIKAREADSRTFHTRVAGVGGVYWPGFSDMPQGDDV